MNGDAVRGAQKPTMNGYVSKPPMSRAPEEVDDRVKPLPNGLQRDAKLTNGYTNGSWQENKQDVSAKALLNGIQKLPPEIRHISQDHYLSLAKLLDRSAQDCWNRLSTLVDRFVEIPMPAEAPIPATGFLQQSKASLEKRDRLLNFAHDQRAIFIKHLVLLQWSKNTNDVGRVVDLAAWIREQRQHYNTAADTVARIKNDLAFSQTPNPDINTAAEILSTSKASNFSNLGYTADKPLTAKETSRTFQRLNDLLCSKLLLDTEIPPQLRTYHVHDGRVTFTVPDEFEVDLSLRDMDGGTQFCLADIRFDFSPSSELPDGDLYNDFCIHINDILSREGLQGCYDYLHELTLSYKLAALHRQALQLLDSQWSGNIRVEYIRRTLVVQYWVNQSAGKSWFEVGVNTGRRKSNLSPSDSYLAVRCFRQSKEAVGAGDEISLEIVDMESVLRQVLASHINFVLDATYDKIVERPIYLSGELSLDQSSSSIEPADCFLRLEVARLKFITASIEPISGRAVLQPASGLAHRMQTDLGAARNLLEDMPQKISYLRCVNAEEELVGIAASAGWEFIRSTLSSTAARALFAGDATRYVFLRRSYWELDFRLAATFDLRGDRWWLIGPSHMSKPSPSLQSQAIDTRALHLEPALTYAYFTKLARWTSGMIVLQNNMEFLTNASIRCILPAAPRFDPHAQLPDLSFNFQPAKLAPVLNPPRKTGAWDPEDFIDTRIPEATSAWICRTIRVKYCGIDAATKQAKVEAMGATNATPKVLEFLARSNLHPDVQIAPKLRQFTIQLQSPVGKAIIDELLRLLLQLENAIACVSSLEMDKFARLESISLSHINVVYRKSPAELGFEITFQDEPSSVHLRLYPENNPHQRISKHLQQYLRERRHALPKTIALLIPILSSTYPLLSLLDRVQRQSLASNASASSSSTHTSSSSLPVPQLHILARHPTMYGLQYFAPAGTAASSLPAKTSKEAHSRMLARFEIFPHTRHHRNTMWIVRPAVENFESYERKSYRSDSLRRKLEAEVFNNNNASNDVASGGGNGGAWMPLSTGAACAIDEPEALINAINASIAGWLNTTHEDMPAPADVPTDAAEAKAAAPLPTGKPGAKAAGTNNNPQQQPRAPPKTSQQQQSGKQQAQARGRVNNNNNNNNSGNASGQAAKPKEIIMLD